MILSVHWVNATRPREERTRIELTYQNALTEYFNGVENAKKAHDYFQTHPQTPFQDWSRANYFAFRSIHNLVTPSEYSRAGFKVEFH